MNRIKNNSKRLLWFFTALMLTAFMIGCGDWKGGGAPNNTSPTIISTTPANGAKDVFINRKITATFNVAMDPTTINVSTFTVQPSGPPLGPIVGGAVSYNPITKTATFTPPASNLATSTLYTATITTGAKSLDAKTLASNYVWSFTTGTNIDATPPPATGLNLKSVAPFGVAATAGVTNTGTAPNTTINGNVVLDPVSGAVCNSVAIDATGGFGLCAGFPPAINGQVISPLFQGAGPTSSTIKADLKAAFLSITPPAGPPAAGSLGGATNIPAGTTLGALTGSALVQGDNLFTPGVYQSLTSILITDDLTLDAQGNPDAIFVFQSSSTVGTADGVASPGAHPRILLTGSAKASNVFWQVGTSATLGTNSEFQGNILASESITMKTGATSCGRMLAGAFAAGAFVFDSNIVSVPGSPSAPATCK